ncbi:MAG: hypothetical protein NC321_01550 [Clostridium sp.]|nr:hypothetical protein [Clostridium sp.]
MRNFQTEPFHTVTSLYLTYPASWFLTFLAHVVCFIIVRRKSAKKWGA